MLTVRQRSVLKKVLGGEPLTALREYPFDWVWSMEAPGEVGRDVIEVGVVAALVGSGAGWCKPTPKTGRIEHQKFVVNRERAEFLLHEPKPSRVDSEQISWIPEGHPSLQPRKKESA